MHHLPKLARHKSLTLKILSTVFAVAALLSNFCYTGYASPLSTQLIDNYRFYQTGKNSIVDFASDKEIGLYLLFTDGKIASIDLKSNQKLWEAEMGNQIISTPLPTDESVYLIGKSSSNIFIRGLAKSTGVTRLQINIPFGEKTISTVERVYLYKFENQLIFVADSGEVCSFKLDDQQIVWRQTLDRPLSAVPYLINDKIFLGLASKQIIALSMIDGNQIAALPLAAPPTLIVSDKNGEFLTVGDKNGFLLQIDWRKNVQSRRFRFGGQISYINETSRGLLISSADNFIYLLSGVEDKLIWKKRLAGRIVGAPLFDDRYVIVTTTEVAAASIIDLRNGKLFDRVTLEKDDFFTGKSLQTNRFFVYSTRTGVLSFTLPFNGGSKKA